MNHDVIISCAVTGDDTKVTKSPHCAITPEQIAATAIAAAQAGAAIVHIHVRDPETGAFSMETRHYREVVKRIRESKVDVIVNLTCGMGGYIVIGEHGLKDTPAPGSDFVTQEERMRHVIDLCHEGLYRPDIATLDCGSLNFGDGNRAYVSTPNYLRQGAAIARDLGVKPELEVFDTGNLWFVKQMIKEGLLDAPSLIQLCMGIPYGVPADVGHLLAMVNALPRELQLGHVRHQPHADALGGAVDTARRQRARRPRGQSVFEQGRVCEQRPAGGKGPHHHRGHGRPHSHRRAGARAAAVALSAPRVSRLPAYRAAILPEWIDYNGHLRDAYYAVALSHAIDEVMDHLGLDAAYRERTQCTLYTLELHMHFLQEVKSTDELTVTHLGAGFRSQAHPRRLRCSTAPRMSEPAATADVMLLHVHQGEKVASASFPPEVLTPARGAEVAARRAGGVGPGFAQDRIEAPVSSMPPGDIRRLIAPRSIALIGASAWTDAVAAGNAAIGYRGTVWRVHPSRPSTSFDHLLSLGRRVAGQRRMPRSSRCRNHDAPGVAGELAARGAGGFVCFTAGFSELATESGHAADARTARAAPATCRSSARIATGS